ENPYWSITTFKTFRPELPAGRPARPAKKDRWTEVSNFSNPTNLIALYWQIILAAAISFYFPNNNRIISSPT
ncbi:unnamed protein product, partial [Rotaria magnacalcarata]